MKTKSIWEAPGFPANFAAACREEYRAKNPIEFKKPPGSTPVGKLSPLCLSLLALRSDLSHELFRVPQPQRAQAMRRVEAVGNLMFGCAKASSDVFAEADRNVGFDAEGVIYDLVPETSERYSVPQNHVARQLPLVAAAIIGGEASTEKTGVLKLVEPDGVIAPEDGTPVGTVDDERLQRLWSFLEHISDVPLVDGPVTIRGISDKVAVVKLAMSQGGLAREAFWCLVIGAYPDLPERVQIHRGWILTAVAEKTPSLASLLGKLGQALGPLAHRHGSPLEDCGEPGCLVHGKGGLFDLGRAVAPADAGGGSDGD